MRRAGRKRNGKIGLAAGGGRRGSWAAAIVGIGVAVLVGLGAARTVGPEEGTAGHSFLTGGVVVGGGMLLSLLTLWIFRERLAGPRWAPSNDVMGFVYATIGVVYSVILGFVVVTTWQQFEEARALEDAESHAVADLIRMTPGLPEPLRAEARTTLIAYLRAVVEIEWPRMAAGESPGDDSLAMLDRMWEIYEAAGEGETAQGALFNAGLERLADLGGLRRDRLHEGRHGIPGVLWVALLIGAALTIGFAAGFSVESWVVHAWLVAALAAMVSLFLLVTVELDRPYTGDIRVEPEQFRTVQEQFGG